MEVPKGLENYGVEKLHLAVRCMREACDDAERNIRDYDTDLGRATAVLHTFIWAWANAQAQVETCLSNVQRWMEAKETP